MSILSKLLLSFMRCYFLSLPFLSAGHVNTLLFLKIDDNSRTMTKSQGKNSSLDKEHGFENAIKECIQNGILKEYLQRKAKEVINMLIAEYDYATDIAVQRAEERKIAYTEGKSLGLAEGKSLGLAEGKSLGLAEGEARGRSEGSHQKALETAKNLLQFGLSREKIAQATGLSKAEVEAIHNS